MLDFLNNNAGFVAILGVIVGWALSSLTSLFLYRRQKKDDEEKDKRERFKNKARFTIRSKFEVREEQIKQKLSVILCSYDVKADGISIKAKYPKELLGFGNLKYEHFYFENIGKSDIYDFEFAVESPKHNAMFKRDLYTKFIKEGLISYGVSSDKMLRKGEIARLTVYYSELDPIINIFSSSLLVFYRDELNNICEQAVFPEQNNIYEPTLISYKEWREHVSVEKNLEHWRKRLKILYYIIHKHFSQIIEQT